MFKKLKSQVQEAVNQLSPQAAAAASNFASNFGSTNVSEVFIFKLFNSFISIFNKDFVNKQKDLIQSSSI
jgi:hypothetical protein